MTPEPSHAAGHDHPLTLVEHLHEPHSRLIKTIRAVALGMDGGLLLAGRAQRYFLDLIARVAPDVEVIATTATEKITVIITIAFDMPVILYQAARLLASGLTRTERRYVHGLLPGTLFCFSGRVAFALAVAIPQMLGFLQSFDDPGIKTPPRAAELLGCCSDRALWNGRAFELPMIMFLCATLNVIPYAVLRQGHKYAVIGPMVLAAFIIPSPDALSMLVLWAPLYLLFELGLILTRFTRPRAGDSTVALPASLLMARQLRRRQTLIAPAPLGGGGTRHVGKENRAAGRPAA